MSPRHRCCVDIHLILRKGDEVLLGQRLNTGFMDGYFHLPSGHLEAEEPATAALVREAQEEIGVTIDPKDARLVHMMHNRTNEGRIALFYEVTNWTGEPANREPGKCSRLQWFERDRLPELLVPYAEDALRHYAEGAVYSERGWSYAGAEP